jgi:enoyl-CoA hydratase/carnithine racemase
MVETRIEGGIARILLNRPEKSNALDTRLLRLLLEAVRDVAGREDARVVVLAGHGKAFCGGADVNELKGLDAGTAGRFVERIHEVCAAIRALPIPVVARLHGAVIGAGLEIAAACDLRIAEQGTKFSMPEVRLGIPSVVEAALLPRLMGHGRAAWLVLTGEAIDARRAYEWGLVEEIGGDAELHALLTKLVAADRDALMVQKRLLQLWEDAPLPQSIAASITAFGNAVASRKPR